jgi:hypothetical protein
VKRGRASKAHSEVFRESGPPLVLTVKQSLFALPMLGSNQAKIGKRDSSNLRGQGANTLLHEVRIWRSLLPLAARFEILKRVRLAGELVQRLPGLVRELPLHNHHILYPDNTKPADRLFLIKLVF